jgi:hypothetical protein
MRIGSWQAGGDERYRKAESADSLYRGPGWRVLPALGQEAPTPTKLTLRIASSAIALFAPAGAARADHCKPTDAPDLLSKVSATRVAAIKLCLAQVATQLSDDATFRQRYGHGFTKVDTSSSCVLRRPTSEPGSPPRREPRAPSPNAASAMRNASLHVSSTTRHLSCFARSSR